MRAEGAIARGGAARGLEQPRAPGSGGAADGLVAEHLQPVVMLLAAQQLRRALAHPLCMLAPLQTPVIEEEPQQFQIHSAIRPMGVSSNYLDLSNDLYIPI